MPRREAHGGRRGKPETLGDRRLDPVGLEFEGVAAPRLCRRAVLQVLPPPELGDDLDLLPFPAAAQQRDLLLLRGIHDEHQVLAPLALDVRVEERVDVTIQHRGDQRGLHDAPAVHQAVEGIIEDARGPICRAASVKGELPLELSQRGVGEYEGGGRDARIQHRIAEHALQLPAFNSRRRGERYGPVPHEHRSDRAARHGRGDGELTILELERYHVASQRDATHRRDAIALRGHVTQLFENRLVAFGRVPVGGPRSRRCRVRSLCPDHGRAAREQQGQGDQDRRGLGHVALTGLDRMNRAAPLCGRVNLACGVVATLDEADYPTSTPSSTRGCRYTYRFPA